MSQARNYNDVLIILCRLYDRLALHMLHFFLFLSWFQSHFKQFKNFMVNSAYLRCLRWTAFIGRYRYIMHP